MARGYAEALALVEAGKQIGLTMAKPAEEKRPHRAERTDRTEKKKLPSFEEMWIEEKKRRDQFDAFMAMMKKQNAEDPKKDGDKKNKLSDIDKVVFLMLASPFIGAAALGFLKTVLQL